MKIIFYYHIPILKKNKKLFCPGFLGVFLDSLALEISQLTLLMHESNEKLDFNYQLKQKNIDFISLGEKKPAWHRILFHKSILKKKLDAIKKNEILLVRSPSPLASYFNKYKGTKNLVYLVIGDYRDGARLMKVSSFRDLLVKNLMIYINYMFLKQLRNNHTIVNSKMLFEKYRHNCKKIDLIKTTTLSQKDFFKRTDTCLNKKINLLYTGRIEREKGLFELFNAFSQIRKKHKNIYLNIVGWEENPGKHIEKELRKISHSLEIENYITFHGYKNIGKELNEMYRMADIYILPSYHEGFPRTLWEAMANSVPLICTSVGSIPLELDNGVDALIIEPKNSNEIKIAIKKLLSDSVLRKTLIKNALIKASQNTLEIQSKKLIQKLK